MKYLSWTQELDWESPLRLMQYMVTNENSNQFMMKQLFLWLKVYLVVTTALYLPMDKLDVVKHLLWLEILKIRHCEGLFQIVSCIFLVALEAQILLNVFWFVAATRRYIKKKFEIYWIQVISGNWNFMKTLTEDSIWKIWKFYQ